MERDFGSLCSSGQVFAAMYEVELFLQKNEGDSLCSSKG